jgi:hypothetical protein
MYRDASNYKAHGSQVVKGEIENITDEEIKAINSIEDFIPYEVGFPALHEELMNYSGGKLTEDDHVWHIIQNMEKTTEKNTVEITLTEFTKKFLTAERNEVDEMVRLGL